MFKKLLSNLPFNPSLINQVAFYARRMNDEARIRRTGLLFVVLAMLLQVFAVISPPQPTLAESDNDIIRGGFQNVDQAVLHCLNGSLDFYEILTYYGLGCDSVKNSSTVYIRSNSADYYSLGRTPVSNPSPRNGKNWSIYQVNIPGVTRTLWMKDLQYWDSGTYSTYKVLKMTNKQGQTMFVMYDCGNIVTIGKYTPPPPPPPPPPTITDVCPGKDGIQTSLDQCDVCPDRTGVQYTLEECDACPNLPGTQNVADCYPCPEARTDASATACLEFDKAASNDTQKFVDANGTKAKAGDVITYTLSVKNIGLTTVQDFVFDENMSDVLEYARITDLHGGNISEDNVVSWPADDIAAGQTMRHMITVKVKDPIPQTPVSASDPGSFDLVMTNVFYGHSVNIELPPNIIKVTERTVKTLPSTGPGTSLAVGFVLVSIMGYFFARSRLMATELAVVKEEFTGGGA